MAEVIQYKSYVVIGITHRGPTSCPSIEQRLNYERRGAYGSGIRSTQQDRCEDGVRIGRAGVTNIEQFSSHQRNTLYLKMINAATRFLI